MYNWAKNENEVVRMQRTDYCAQITKQDIGRKATVTGWIQRNRDLGGLAFVNLRDSSGIMQVVFPGDDSSLAAAHTLGREDVVAVTGTITARDTVNINPDMTTGEIELRAEKLEILNRARTPPFLIEGSGEDTTEETRLRFRYVDIRRERMQSNLLLRHQVFKKIRDFFDEQGFIEIETPILTKSTPEGARDFLVPSRIEPGKFYALPQSPQLFKQLLMIGGIDRYFQLAKCFRDEDLRADRQPEFTQLDFEIAFPRGKEEIISLLEKMLDQLFRNTLNVHLPQRFPCLSYHEAIARYGSDKPDLRFGMEIEDISHLVKGCEYRIFTDALAVGGKVLGINACGCAGYSRSQIDRLQKLAVADGAGGLLWIKVGEEISSPLAKFITEERLQEIVALFGATSGDLILIVAGEGMEPVLGSLRVTIAHQEKMEDDDWHFLWVTDFPLFEHTEEGELTSSHHPFTSPRQQDIAALESRFATALADSYDLVLNGVELGSGSIRIHSRALQERIFTVLGFDKEEMEERFGFFLHALEYGTPPHGGFALGLDRCIMMMARESSIRDVIAFPKTTTGLCPLTNAPMSVTREQLNELKLQKQDETRKE
ncbi:TPA: aspartate--tRNA ligase [Candidatus Acetothermia bacterium]|nr:aspartate--tRNA ligase [Candidatus Acetothermia bacterium]